MTFTTGDTGPALAGSINANLTGATATVHIRRPDRTVITKPATITDAANGGWSIDWATGDLSIRGKHYVEVEVTFSSGKIQTFSQNAGGSDSTFVVREQIA